MLPPAIGAAEKQDATIIGFESSFTSFLVSASGMPPMSFPGMPCEL